MQSTVSDRATGKRSKRRRKSKKQILSKTRKPPEMSLEQWQTELRRQFGREQRFRIQHVDGDRLFGQFRVSNPASGNSYRVKIRGGNVGDNFCACPDFATNTLGTCKHIEGTLSKLLRRPGAKQALARGFRQERSEVALRYGAQRQAKFFPGENCAPELEVLAVRYFGPDRSLRSDAFAKFEKFLEEAQRIEPDFLCEEDVLSFIAEMRDRDDRARRIDQAFPQGIRTPSLDKVVRADLYDYQKKGALFAARAGRCLIGDEMGLGKTIQAIAAAEIMARHLGVARVLIICPTSLKHQWEREINRFTGRSAAVIQGLRPQRQELFAADSFFKITNYDTIHSDLDLIEGWSPDLVILDEAQRIKNWSTRAARSVKKIVSPYAIVLTGTPLENRLEELVSIVQFVDQHRLGPTFRFLHDHQVTDDVGKVIGYRNLDTIGQSLAPILIRRQKSEVLKQLPGRLDKNFFVPMTPQQLVHHEENKEIVGRVVQKWRHRGFLSESDQRRLMIALQNMRMSCNSTYLLDQETDYGVKADELMTLLEEIFERPEEKVVVFSQWQRTHELINRRMKSRGLDHVQFHGGVPGPKRKPLVDRFREDPACRAFLSTDAGGVGLNLQHAAVVVNMDLPWNPAVLEQRIGRVHRLGQKRPVQVVNFISTGTIEEGMLSVLKFKKSLFSGALDGGEKEVFLGGSRLTRFMETVDKATSAIRPAAAEEPAASPAHEDPTGHDGGDISTLAARGDRQDSEAITTPAAASDVWSGLLEAGLSFLQGISGAAGGRTSQVASGATTAASLIREDRDSGKPYLHLPVPSKELVDRLLGVAGELLRSWGK